MAGRKRSFPQDSSYSLPYSDQDEQRLRIYDSSGATTGTSAASGASGSASGSTTGASGFSSSSNSSYYPRSWSWTETIQDPNWTLGPAWFQGPGTFVPSEYAVTSSGQWSNQRQPHSGRGYRGNQTHRGKKKQKREPVFSHFCDSCDRGFKNEQKYNEHVIGHTQCTVPGCHFVANENIVRTHWMNSHASGNSRIKLDTPEEIAKWREERRKNYPTLQNIQRKQKILEMRLQEGGVLETAQFGRMRGRGRGRGRGWHGRGSRGRNAAGRNHGDWAETPKTFSQTSRDVDPLGALASNDHDSDREEPAEQPRKALTVAPKQMSSALGALLANYGSASESDEEPDAAPVRSAKEAARENKEVLNKMPPSGNARGNGGTTEMFSKDNGGGRGRWRRKGRRGRRQDTPQRRGPTLLEMLLAPDIRHERNVLLQCVRYVVQNNFFGAEEEDTPKETSQMSKGATVRNYLSRPETTGADAEQDGGTLCGQAASEPSEGSADPVQEDFPQKKETAPSMGSPVTDTITYNMYDDEIWESPAAPDL